MGYVDSDFGSSLGWWAATIATYCPSRMMEHLIPISTQPRSETFWVTLYYSINPGLDIVFNVLDGV